MKVIIFLAEGFEEVEALTTVDYLRRKDIVVDTISITKEKEVRGAHNIVVLADKVMDEIGDIDSYDGVIIPGGLPGATNLRDHSKVVEVVRKVFDSNKLAAAICAGPIVFERAGIIKGRKVTSYPGFAGDLKDAIYEEENVVVDKNIITARGPALAVDFALAIVEYLMGKEKAEELKKDILYK